VTGGKKALGATKLDWQRLVEAGLANDLLPVVCDPDVPISPTSTLTSLGKTPSAVDARGRVHGIKDWTTKFSTEDEIQHWASDGRLGICLQTRLCKVFDVDVEDHALANRVEDVLRLIIAEFAGVDPSKIPLRFRDNSSKFAILVRCEAVIKKRNIQLGELNKIEFLGNGQQAVIAGTHPSGSRIKWEGDITNAPSLTADQIETVWHRLEAEFRLAPARLSAPVVSQPHPLVEAQLPSLAAALAVIPADDRELWVRMGHALKTLGEAAKPLWHEWSARSVKYDSADAERVWASFQPDRTGLEAIFAEARRCGWAGTSPRTGRNSGDPVLLDLKSLPILPPAVPFVISGWLPADVVTLFSAHGGAGKSFISLYVAICVAVGRHPFRIGEAVLRKRVIMYSAEDDLIALQGRLRRYLDYLRIDEAALEGWLLILDATACDNVLFKTERDGCGTTARFEWLASAVQTYQAALVIFDNASDALDANENDRTAVRQFFSALRRLKTTVLLLSHVDAASSMAKPRDAKGYSGSTAWNNSARSRWFLTRDETGLTLTQPKVNYARAGSQVTFQWDSAHQVFAVTGCYDEAPTGKAFRPLLLKLIAAVLDEGTNISISPNATNNAFALIKARQGFPRGLDRATVLQEIAAWRAEGLAALEDYTLSNRRSGRRLVLTDAGLAVAYANAPYRPFQALPTARADSVVQ
jgi:RecA-family ATPase